MTDSPAQIQTPLSSALQVVFCLAEDREDCETGVRLAVASLCDRCPGVPVVVFRPGDSFSAWARKYPQVRVIASRPQGANQWNCKPHALLPLLAQGFHSAIWLDSDVLVTRDCTSRLTSLPENVLVVAQEPASLPLQGSEVRTRGWGFEVGRRIPLTLNTAVLRVTSRHIPLLERWMECLAHPEYTRTQRIPLADRPVHLMSDQDVLNAILGDKAFADIPINLLMSGVEIIHAGGALGFSLSERVKGLSRLVPTFLHATAGKPWHLLGNEPYWNQPGFFNWYRRLLQETSPYVAASRRYKKVIDCETTWMDRSSVPGLLLRWLGLGHFALTGLPLTISATILARLSSSGAPSRTNG